MNEMRKIIEAIEKIEESRDEYTAEGAIFAAGYEAGFKAGRAGERYLELDDEIRKAFHEFTYGKYSTGEVDHE
jgi:hypothetical protein